MWRKKTCNGRGTAQWGEGKYSENEINLKDGERESDMAAMSAGLIEAVQIELAQRANRIFHTHTHTHESTIHHKLQIDIN